MRLTAMQLDAVRELGMIGAGHAATGLSTLLGARVTIRVPDAWLIDVADVAELLGGAEQPVAAVSFQISGRMAGYLLFVFPTSEAVRFVARVMSRPLAHRDLAEDALARSALKEIGNIACGAYVSAFAKLAQAPLVPSVPSLAIDMLQAVLDGILCQLAKSAEHALVLQTTYALEGQAVRGHLLFFTDADGVRAMVEALRALPTARSAGAATP